jgi:hypothetical protein
VSGMNKKSDKSRTEKRFLVVKAKGGMGNRMLCAVTGILYGQITGRATVIDWRDAAYSNDGSNTFSRFFSAPQVLPETAIPSSASVRPAIWTGQLEKSMSTMLSENDPDKHRSIRIHRKYSIDVRMLDYPDDIVVFWYYMGRVQALRANLQRRVNSFAGLSVDGIIRKVLIEQMRLSDEMRQRIDDFKSARGWPEKVIGLHIRYTDMKTDLGHYERALQRFLEREPSAHIFLATDNGQIELEYQQRYKNVISTPKWFPADVSTMHQNSTCPDRVLNGMEALTDMYLLADCDYLVYAGGSTFSQIARLLSDLPGEDVVDIERFDLKVRLKRLIRELVV